MIKIGVSVSIGRTYSNIPKVGNAGCLAKPREHLWVSLRRQKRIQGRPERSPHGSTAIFIPRYDLRSVVGDET